MYKEHTSRIDIESLPAEGTRRKRRIDTGKMQARGTELASEQLSNEQ
jgi:hypothetical protein